MHHILSANNMTSLLSSAEIYNPYNALCQRVSRLITILLFSVIMSIFPLVVQSAFAKASADKAELKGGIISLKPNITEILFALGVGDRLVGVTTYCDYPPAVRKIDKVADYVQVDVEKVLIKRPSLVIGSEENSSKGDVEFLKREGIDVRLYPFGRLSDTYRSIEQIASLLEVPERGKKLVSDMQRGLGLARHDSHKTTLLVVGIKPLVVVGSNNLLDDLLKIVGGKNIAGRSKLRYPAFGTEQLIAAQPDVIIDLTMGNEVKGRTASLSWYRQFSSVPAVRNNQIYFLDVADLSASPRMVVGAGKLSQILNSP